MPDAIGGYTVLERLGAGGMGVVYLVEDPRTGARLAMKVLGAGAGVEERLRFTREAQAMAAVDDHEHVLRIHSAGKDGGHAFFVMDLAVGGDLATRLHAGPLPAGEVARLGLALARGLAHVHARGVLHRDLKPSNVLLDERGTPRLVDFGLAQVAGAERLTVTGTVLGTPAYMSPEQAEGRRDVDARSDVYGLGALLYHALTGRPPFQGSSVVATLHAVTSEAPRPPREQLPDVPPALEAIILRALRKAPAARFPSAGAMAEALAAVDRLAPAPGKRALGVALALVTVLAVVAGLALVAGLPAPSAPPPAPPAPTTPAAVAPDALDALDALDASELERLLVDGLHGDAFERLEAAWGAQTEQRAAVEWAATFALAADDAPQARAWRARAARDQAWAAAALDVVGGEELPATEPGWTLRAFEEARAAALAWSFSLGDVLGDLAEKHAPIARLVVPPGARVPSPLRLGLAVRAQAALWTQRSALVEALSVVQPGQQRPWRDALAGASALEPRTGFALGFDLLRLGVDVGTDAARLEGWKACAAPDTLARVEALADRVPELGALHALLWFKLVEVRDATPAWDALAPRLWERLVPFGRSIGALDPAGRWLPEGRSTLGHAVELAVEGRSHVAMARASLATPDERARCLTVAWAATEALPAETGALHRARVHLFERSAAAARLELDHEHSAPEGLARLRALLELELALLQRVPPALANRKLEQARQALEGDGLELLACFTALVLALDGQHDEAARWMDRPDPGRDHLVPWRTRARTREDLAALRARR